jgi:sensor histidine kinase YesM
MTNKNIRNSLIITAFFNTGIALVLYYLVMKDARLTDLFIISQFIGLSICAFVSGTLEILGEQGLFKATLGILLGLGLGILLGSLLSWAYMHHIRGMEIGFFLKDVFWSVLVFGVIFGVPIIYFFVSREQLQKSENRVREEKIKRLTLEKEAAMTSLRLLQAQIEPHFLFNTLANVISLFEVDTTKARQMLINLNHYLRISLERTRREMITLDKELALVRHYLDIFKIRMGDRLAYEIRDHTKGICVPFPPLIIQPLVENAIKYGIEPGVAGGRILIESRIENQRLYIIVADTGRGIDPMGKTGIGINNVSQRLEAIYGNKAALRLTTNSPQGLTACIEVPL